MLLNFTSLQFLINSQVPHFFLLQSFTFSSSRSLSLVFSTNLALVKSFLKFVGCLLLLTSWTFCIAFLISGPAWRMSSVSFMILYMSGFLGSWVATKHSICFWSSFCSLSFCSCCFGILRASVILLLTSHFGYPWFCNVTLVLFRCSVFDSSSSTILHTLLARLKGMLLLM